MLHKQAVYSSSITEWEAFIFKELEECISRVFRSMFFYCEASASNGPKYVISFYLIFLAIFLIG